MAMPASHAQAAGGVFELICIYTYNYLLAEPCRDVNSNGTISILDALMTAQYYIGLNPPEFDQAAAAVSGDDVVTIIAALQMTQFHAGLPGQYFECDSVSVELSINNSTSLENASFTVPNEPGKQIQIIL